MTTIINGTTDAITFPDATIQNTSAIVGGKVPYINLPAGSVLQVIQSTSTSQFTTTSATPVDAGFSATITPKFSSSKILVLMTGNGAILSSGVNWYLYIYRNTTPTGYVNAVEYNGISSGTLGVGFSLNYLDSPATTSATTYRLYVNSNGSASGYIRSDPSTMMTVTLIEVAA